MDVVFPYLQRKKERKDFEKHLKSCILLSKALSLFSTVFKSRQTTFMVQEDLSNKIRVICADILSKKA